MKKISPDTYVVQVKPGADIRALLLGKSVFANQLFSLFKIDALLLYVFLYSEYENQKGNKKRDVIIVDPKNYFEFYNLENTDYNRRYFTKHLRNLKNSVFLAKKSNKFAYLIEKISPIPGYKYELKINPSIFSTNEIKGSYFNMNELKGFFPSISLKSFRIYSCLKYMLTLYSMIEFEESVYKSHIPTQFAKKKEFQSFVMEFMEYLKAKGKIMTYTDRRYKDNWIIEVFMLNEEVPRKLYFLDLFYRKLSS